MMNIAQKSGMKYAFITYLILMSYALSAQEAITWADLTDVTWSEQYDSLSGYTNTLGTYGEHLQSLNGKEVFISGYVIGLDAMGLNFALSRTSYASCFFCGQAGPETVMELKIPPRSVPPERQNDYKLRFKGTLILKDVNPNGLNYILQNAEWIE